MQLFNAKNWLEKYTFEESISFNIIDWVSGIYNVLNLGYDQVITYLYLKCGTPWPARSYKYLKLQSWLPSRVAGHSPQSEKEYIEGILDEIIFERSRSVWETIFPPLA